MRMQHAKPCIMPVIRHSTHYILTRTMNHHTSFSCKLRSHGMSLAWLSSQWCLKNSGDAVPTHYYRVSLLSNGLLQITYSQRDSSSFKYYTYVAINHGYFDLWDASGYSGSLKNERFRRLEKHSESEYAVVYIGKGYPLHSSSQRALPKMAKQKASEIGPEKYIRKPKIFVKCGI